MLARTKLLEFHYYSQDPVPGVATDSTTITTFIRWYGSFLHVHISQQK